jgi:hypothetical protein
VIDVNTGRFVGSRGRSSAGRLEDTITKNNLEAVKEVVRQLRLRDIGGIIVIDFIDMANPKNRATVEEALKTELERDRTKTYVVEISPLGLVEMTRQNVTDGPREILTRKCTVCGGAGLVLSMASPRRRERHLRALAAARRVTKGLQGRAEREGRLDAGLPGASAAEDDRGMRTLAALPDGLREDVAVNPLRVLGKGTLEEPGRGDAGRSAARGSGPESSSEVGPMSRTAGVGKLDVGLTVVVAARRA